MKTFSIEDASEYMLFIATTMHEAGLSIEDSFKVAEYSFLEAVMIKISYQNILYARESADELLYANFIWSNTPEGMKYWARLHRIAYKNMKVKELQNEK